MIGLKRGFLKIIFLSILFCSSVYGINIRGSVVQLVTIVPEEGYVTQVSGAPGEYIGLFLEKDSELLNGIVLEVVLTDSQKQYYDSFALELYHNIKPDPGTGIITVEGEQGFFKPIPYLNTLELRIPVHEAVQFYDMPGKYIVPRQITYERFPLLFSVQTILKGIPDSILLKNYYIKIKTELEQKGYLDLTINMPETLDSELIEVYINEKLVEMPDSHLLVDTGIHSLTVVADGYPQENSSFSIETGKTTEVNIELKASAPRVFIEALPGTIIMVDGNKLEDESGEGIELTEGEHTFLFKIGDYSLSKIVNINSGKKYYFSLFFDLDIKEY